MKTVCAASVTEGAGAFATLGDVAVRPDREIGPADLSDADALVVRSKTRVDRALLEGSRVRYVGTATAGFDHLDTAWLEEAGIAWYAAAGCNAESVADWFTSALLCLASRRALTLEGLTLAVVGVGQVGRRVARRAEALGLRVLLNDPPRRLAEQAPGLLPLEAVLPEADIVTLHVPLTGTGPFATRRMAGSPFFEQLKPGAVFVNASRGEVVDEEALLFALRSDQVSRVLLDVWENEPAIRPGLLEAAELGTPHIAGYSFDGKRRGTEQVYADLCHFLERPPAWTGRSGTPVPGVPLDRVAEGVESVEEALWRAVRRVYDVSADDRALRGPGGDAAALAARFEALRKEYPVRREFATARVSGRAGTEVCRRLRGLGFRLP